MRGEGYPLGQAGDSASCSATMPCKTSTCVAVAPQVSPKTARGMGHAGRGLLEDRKAAVWCEPSAGLDGHTAGHLCIVWPESSSVWLQKHGIPAEGRWHTPLTYNARLQKLRFIISTTRGYMAGLQQLAAKGQCAGSAVRHKCRQNLIKDAEHVYCAASAFTWIPDVTSAPLMP